MPEVILVTAIYENGVLRPLNPLPLKEHQTVKIQVLPEDSAAELERIAQSLATAGQITPPPRQSDVEPVKDTIYHVPTLPIVIISPLSGWSGWKV